VNYLQAPAGGALLLTRGPPGYLFGLDSASQVVVYQLGVMGATFNSFGGLIYSANQTSLDYSGGNLYASQGEVMDVSTPSDPLLAARLRFSPCALALRSPTRILMLCHSPVFSGPILRVVDTSNFVPVASATVPVLLLGLQPVMNSMAYLGGDAVALIAAESPTSLFQLYIMHFPIIADPP